MINYITVASLSDVKTDKPFANQQGENILTLQYKTLINEWGQMSVTNQFRNLQKKFTVICRDSAIATTLCN